MQTGVVEKLYANPVTTKFGQKTAYKIKVDGTYYGLGFKLPAGVADGVTVSFVAGKNAGGYDEATNVTVTGGAPAPQQAPPQQESVAPQPVVKASPPRIDVAIAYQHCQKEAQRIFATFLEKEVVKLPAKQSAKFDAGIALINEISDNLYVKLASVVKAGGVELEDIIPDPDDEE